MGTWGTGTFDNDTACDWAYDLEESHGTTRVHDAIAKVLTAEGEYLDSDVACEGLAACEVVARLKGNWGTRDSYTKTVDAWVQAHPVTPPAALVHEALRAIDRILQPPSELLELWDEGDGGAEWRAGIADLRARVAK
jgi:hypothetical protein